MHYMLPLALGGVSLVLYALLSIVRSLFSSTRAVPGPFLARFSNFWYTKRVYAGNFETKNCELHKTYGPIVRYGPNRFSFDDPEATKIIFGHGTQFAKSSWYDAWTIPGTWNLFNERHIKTHAQHRRLFQSTYSMSSLVHYEPYVDECADLFSQRLLEVSEAGIVIDMGHWFQCYAFDVIGQITYAERLGFLDKGEDIAGFIKALDQSFPYSALVGIFPSLHPPLFGLANYIEGNSGVGTQYVNNMTQRKIDQHKAEAKVIPVDGDHAEPFVSKFLRQHTDDPARFTKFHILTGCGSNMIAGSDTTAISLSATLYYLLKTPRCLEKLRTEILEFQEQGRLSKSPTFKESQDMPYLQAVIKEALRMHPATGLPLERVVPEGGATISGTFFPEGTIVSVNTWVQHRNRGVFGEDADSFNPERWLSNDAERISLMNRYWMPFGLGSRTCIGRHISMLEMCKLIPRIVRDFDFQLDGSIANPNVSWKTTAYWFVKPRDFNVRVTPRQEVAYNEKTDAV
ncbi:unnamed protein product [Clonostachys chloroleuca]|uniref:Uncharacterized protein n=1 Tax=Clonostachys chloroleuca TaxID=1926264 RepID=A0AA35LY08_9HYPO|nr:unnamed protein product [Clonostachys chloroleuca]